MGEQYTEQGTKLLLTNTFTSSIKSFAPSAIKSLEDENDTRKYDGGNDQLLLALEPEGETKYTKRERDMRDSFISSFIIQPKGENSINGKRNDGGGKNQELLAIEPERETPDEEWKAAMRQCKKSKRK